jgi:hypothetical protein
MKGSLLLPLVILASGCPWNAAGTSGCRPTGPPLPLPEALNESSGIARSLSHPGVLWTHNDGQDPSLYAIDETGSLLATIRVSGARMRDWEDLATAPCGDEACIYLADTGDNLEVRPEIQLLRLPDTGAVEDGSREAQVFPMTLPDGPRDIEALYVLPGEDVYLVSKGRNDANTVYRYPPPLREGERVTLQEVQTLSEGAMPIPAQITGADASSDGRYVVIRTYQDMVFYRVEEGHLIPMEGARVALRTLQEPQGEGVAFGDGNRVLLTTEAGPFGGEASLRILECQIAH